MLGKSATYAALSLIFLVCSHRVLASGMEQVGDVSFPISCSADGVQEAFDHAIALLHNMTYVVAGHEFRQITADHPECAMAHWGVAMTLIHPVWPQLPTNHELQRGAAELALARGGSDKTKREEDFIDALGAFYDERESVDHWTRIRRWDAAQAALFEKYPTDDEALAFAALLHIAAAPKDDLEFRMNRDAGSHLEALIERRPKHPGGIHYLIHAYDNAPLAERALGAARSYGAIAPEVPHALHMPSHIFTRRGLWPESVAWNIRARAASRNVPVDGGLYGGFGHSSDYMTYAYLQQGKDDEAREVRDVLFSVELENHFGNAYALAAIPARIALELGDWKRAAALEVRNQKSLLWDDHPAYLGITHFARGIGLARNGQLEEVEQSARALGEISERLKEGSPYWAKQVAIQKSAVEAWGAYAARRLGEAFTLMQRAADAEDALDKHPVTPGPVLPAHELYADMLSLEGRWAEALAAYETTLRTSPNRFNSLAGAGVSAERLGDADKARVLYGQLLMVAGDGNTTRSGLARAREYLDRN